MHPNTASKFNLPCAPYENPMLAINVATVCIT